MVQQTAEFERRADELLARELDEAEVAEVRELEDVVDMGARLCIRLPQLAALRERLEQTRWLKRALDLKAENPTPETLRRVLTDADLVPSHARVEIERANIAELLDEIDEWESKAKNAISKQVSLKSARLLLAASERIPATLPTRQTLATAVSHAQDWLKSLQEVQARDLYPYCHSLEELLRRARSIPLKLEESGDVSAALDEAKEWRRGAADIFLGAGKDKNLMEALCPRAEAQPKKRKRGGGSPVPVDSELLRQVS